LGRQAPVVRGSCRDVARARSAPDDSLDPAAWQAFKKLAHRLLDDALDQLRTVRDRPVWQPVPDAVRQALAQPLPVQGQGIERTCRELRELILPYPTGNAHPRFWGWVHGSGTPGGILAELIAAAMNANCGGRDHGAVYVERQVIAWCRELFKFPDGASGIVVSGTSLATLIGLAVARHHLAGADVRAEGLPGVPAPLVGYASVEAHGSVMRAFEILGLAQMLCAASRRIGTAASIPRRCAGPSPQTGPRLSRGLRALKVWFTLKEHGARRLGAAIERNCDQARYLPRGSRRASASS
jgi:glutamate/tyrosine decarboxylase-like PLP-dependent enzyme